MINLSTEKNLGPIEVWGVYTAMSLHFNPDRTFDAFKFNFKGPRVRRETFMKNRNRFQFEKLAKTYKTKNDIILYCLANLVAGKEWITEFNDDVFITWQGNLQRIEYIFKEDLNILADYCDDNDMTFDTLIMPPDRKNLPCIYKLLHTKSVTIETLAIIESLVGFTPDLDKRLTDPLEVAKGISHKVRGYSTFLSKGLEKERFLKIILNAFSK